MVLRLEHTGAQAYFESVVARYERTNFQQLPSAVQDESRQMAAPSRSSSLALPNDWPSELLPSSKLMPFERAMACETGWCAAVPAPLVSAAA
jgi:hypothetical protein